jgi:hypothetical protein
LIPNVLTAGRRHLQHFLKNTYGSPPPTALEQHQKKRFNKEYFFDDVSSGYQNTNHAARLISVHFPQEHLKSGSSGITTWPHCSQMNQLGRCSIGMKPSA